MRVSNVIIGGVQLCAAGSALLLLLIATSKASALPHVSVGPNVHVSKDAAMFVHGEVLAAASATDPHYLLACSMVFSPEKSDYVVHGYASRDGGRTWSLSRAFTEGRTDWDPSCASDSKGQLLISALTFNTSRDMMDTLIDTSADGGDHWLGAAKIQHLERDFLVADPLQGPKHGAVYIYGTPAFGPTIQDMASGGHISINVYRRLPGEAFRLSNIITSHWLLGGRGDVLPDGSLLLPVIDWSGTGTPEWPTTSDQPLGTLKVLTLRSDENKIANTADLGKVHDAMIWTAMPLPAMAVDHSKSMFSGRAYIVWPDQKTGRMRLMFSRSLDGRSWSTPRMIDDSGLRYSDPANKHIGDANIVVNNEGIVGVSWYDRRDSSGFGWSERFAASIDGGDTFLPSVKVSSSPTLATPQRWGVDATTTDNYYISRANDSGLEISVRPHSFTYGAGHTTGLAASADGVFHPVWVDDRTGLAQLWTAGVTVEAAALRNGSAELSALTDVSSNALFEISKPLYDFRAGTVTLEARIRNTGTKAIKGPIDVRITDLNSGVCHPAILRSDNGLTGVGAIFDFSSRVDGETLAPHRVSGARPLTIALRDLIVPRPGMDRQSSQLFPEFFKLNARVLAGGFVNSP